MSIPRVASLHVVLLCATLLSLCVNILNPLAQGTTPQRGFQPGGAYSVSDIETISMASGNMILNFPFGKLPAGRGGLSAQITLLYNSNLYDSHISYQPDYSQPPVPGTGESPLVQRNIIRHSDEGGWRYGVGYALKLINRMDEYPLDLRPRYPDNKALDKYRVKMSFPDGSLHDFILRGSYSAQSLYDGYTSLRPDGWRAAWVSGGNCSGQQYPLVEDKLFTTGTLTYYTADGTYLRLDVEHDADTNPINNPWTLHLPGGGRVSSRNGSQRIYDRNNNYVELVRTTLGNGHEAIKLVDEVGREVVLEYGYGQNEDAIHVKGTNGVGLTYRIKWKSIQASKSYLTTSEADGGMPDNLSHVASVISEIVLPSQAGELKYTFDYNAPDVTGGGFAPTYGWGQVSAITLPSGAKATYQYSLDGVSGDLYWDAVLRNSPTRKDLTYRLENDNPSNVSNLPCNSSNESCTTETWLYSLSPALPNIGVGHGSMTGPDGGVVSEIIDRFGQAYLSQHADGTIVERIWKQNVPQGHPVLSPANLSSVNGYVKTEFTSIRDARNSLVKTAIKDYEYDKNGNVLLVKEYDWTLYHAVPRDSGGKPTGVPEGLTPQRVVTNNYYADTSDASDNMTVDSDAYHMTTAPHLLACLASSEISDSAQTVSRTEFFYDDPTSTGNLIEQKSWDSHKDGITRPLSRPLGLSNSISVKRQYDTYGNPTLTTDALGNRTQHAYEAVNGFAGLYPTEARSALNTAVQRTFRQEYDFWTGLPTRTIDVDNNVSTLTVHDVFGRPTLIRSAEGQPEEAQTTTTYSDVSRVVITRSDLNTTGDGQLVTVNHFDQLGRVRLSRQMEADIITGDALTDETVGIKVQSRYKIDGVNHLSYQIVSNPYRATSLAGAAGEATMGWSRVKTDHRARVVEAQTFGGADLPAPWGANANSTGKVTTAYDAEMTTVTDQSGRMRRSVTDGLSRLQRVDEPDSNNNLGAANAPTQPTVYQYDALSNLCEVRQGGQFRTGQYVGGQTRSFQYSSLSRLVSATSPESGTVSYEYDANGNVQKKSDSRRLSDTTTPVTISCAYDELNRLKSRSYNDTATPNVAFRYDDGYVDASGVFHPVARARGRLTSVASSVSASNYTGYDAHGRVTGSSQITDRQTYTMSYGYNLAGALTWQQYPSGKTVSTEYDHAGRIAGVKSEQTGNYYAGGASADANNRIRYTAHGAPSGMRLGNGLWEHTGFNSRLQLAQIRLGNASGEPSHLRLEYDYGSGDNNGNVKSQTISVEGLATLSQRYTYDGLNRVETARETGATGEVWKQKFLYDAYGNRRVDDHPTQTTPALVGTNPAISGVTNRIEPRAGEQYGYDAAGNLDRDHAGHTYLYDADNHLTKYKGGVGAGDGASYRYDGEGRRVAKLTPTEMVVYVYDALGRLVAEYSSERWSKRGTSYVTQDGLGSVRMVTDNKGEVRSRHDYLPFGEELAAGTGGRTTQQGYGGTDNMRRKFTGYERDNETGLDYAQARYYSSTQGRFTSTDPLYFQAMMAIDPQRFNLYAYARNNPLKFIDPSGERVYLRGDTDFLRTSVLYEMAGGQENFDQYFQITNGQVVARTGVDASGANAGVQEMLGLVNATENYIYFAGTDGTAAADLFQGSRDDTGRITSSGRRISDEFTGNNRRTQAAGSVVGTRGRLRGVNEPANLANGDPVFAIIAYNTNAMFTQSRINYQYTDISEIGRNGCAALVCGAQRSGVGQVVRAVSFFIHESSENLEFARIGASQANYDAAHQYAMRREAAIRRELRIGGGFAGGMLERRVSR